MPYVPSKKTDGKSLDREMLDSAVEMAALISANRIQSNFSLIKVYKALFLQVAKKLQLLAKDDIDEVRGDSEATLLAKVIYDVAHPYKYEGAFLGELNYATTRFIQRVPQLKVASGVWKDTDELRYWLYACTVEALTSTAADLKDCGCGISGVFEDVKDEYKRRVNTAYEAAQIIKSGDCYDTPYYTRLVPVVSEDGSAIGHCEVMLKRSEATLAKDILDFVLVLKKHSAR